MKKISIRSILSRLIETSESVFKHSAKDQLIKSECVIMCNNLQDARVLNKKMKKKVQHLKTMENIYLSDTSLTSSISLLVETPMLNKNDDIYAEVFDSLNIDSPPPIPSRKVSMRAPERPPYPSTMLKRRSM